MIASRPHAGTLLLLLILAGVAPHAQTQAVRHYAWKSDHVYPVRTGLGITTEIDLGPAEVVEDYSLGFSSGWELGRRGSVFYLKPRDVDVDTNLVVRTAARTYLFELIVAAKDWKTLDEALRSGVAYRIAFDGEAPAAAPPSAAGGKRDSGPEASTAILPWRSYHFDYDVAAGKGAAAGLVPASVHDDGRFTYIRLGVAPDAADGYFPAVFMRQHERDEDALVNVSVEGRTLIVHGTYPYLVLRHGKTLVGLRRNREP